VIETDAAPDEFLAVASALLLHRTEAEPVFTTATTAFRVGVLGPIGGVGTTEIAIGIASSLARKRPTTLLDLDQQTPSVAQRLDLPLHPNLLTAVYAAHQSDGRLRDAILDHDCVDVVGGLVKSAATPDLAPVEVEGLLDEMGRAGYQVLVADLGVPSPELFDLLRFHVLIVVGSANPVGLGRLVRTAQVLASRPDPSDMVAVVNRVGSGVGRPQEIRAEMARLLPAIPLILLPEDRRLELAAWDGVTPDRGPFAKALGSVASLIDEAI
jgi:MinD-like ATPase involved in chromosome partitioning or flagellar assembly